METKQTIGKAIPVLASLDLKKTLKFYEEVLGFDTQHYEDFSYGIVLRGETEIHFWPCEDKYIAESTSCYIRVTDIHALHEELKQKRPSLPDIRMTPWGMAEAYILDPDGNLIKFGQPIDEILYKNNF